MSERDIRDQFRFVAGSAIEGIAASFDRHAGEIFTGTQVAETLRKAADALKTSQSKPTAELDPHAYVPSAMHMGDCAVCGHMQGAAIHSPFRAGR